MEMEYKITTKSEMETIELAQNFESEKFPNMIICLNGELGSGKTMFVKGLANALGIEETITSPTFTIIKEYLYGELPLYHLDVYRLDGASEDIGIEEQQVHTCCLEDEVLCQVTRTESDALQPTQFVESLGFL